MRHFRPLSSTLGKRRPGWPHPSEVGAAPHQDGAVPEGAMERTRGHPALLVSPPCQHPLAPASLDQAPQPSGSGGIAMFYLAKGQHVASASREEENEVPHRATNLPKVLQKHFSHPKQNAPKSRVRTMSQGTEPGVLQPRQISSQHQSPPVRVAQSPRHSSLAELRFLPGPNPS